VFDSSVLFIVLSVVAGSTLLVNRFLEHLEARNLSPATVRAYAFGLANFDAFVAQRRLDVTAVAAVDLFAYVGWQRARGDPAAATMNRRVSTVRSEVARGAASTTSSTATLGYIDWFNHRRLHRGDHRRQQLPHAGRARGHLLPSEATRP
jgi:hypothetical protein